LGGGGGNLIMNGNTFVIGENGCSCGYGCFRSSGWSRIERASGGSRRGEAQPAPLL